MPANRCCGRKEEPPKEPTLQENLIAKWSPTIRKSDHIFTWTGDGELAYLAEIASNAKTGLELGVYMGRSSKVMLDASPGLHLWSVDPFMVDGTYETTRYFLRDEIAQGRCEVIRKYTPQAVEQMNHMRGKLDLVFIDGAHDFSNVQQDIKMWAPFVRMGGILCGHDMETPPRYPEDNDVAKAVKFCLAGWWTEPVPRVWAYIKNKEPW